MITFFKKTSIIEWALGLEVKEPVVVTMLAEGWA